MKFRTSLDSRAAGEGARAIKDLIQRHWHLDSVGLGNCRAAQAIRRELNEQLLIQSAALANANFDSNEPRDSQGRWTIEASGASTNNPVPAPPVKPGETSPWTGADEQVHAAVEAIDDATSNPFLHQLLQRTLRMLTTFGPHSAGLNELSGLSKAIVADAAAAMMHAPEFGGNIRAFILGKEMPVDKALRNAAVEQQFRGEAPAATVAGKLSADLAESLPMILATRGLPVGVQKIVDSIFTLKMLKDAPGIAKQLIEEYRKPLNQRDANKIDSLITEAMETPGFTGLHALGSKKSSKAEPAESHTNAGESKYSEPAALPKPDDAPDNGAAYARPKRAAAERTRPELTPAQKGNKVSKIDRASFRSQREAIWKSEAKNNPGKYSAQNIARMKKGKPPIGSDGHPVELHHIDRTQKGGLRAMTRSEHRLGGNYQKNHSPIRNHEQK